MHHQTMGRVRLTVFLILSLLLCVSFAQYKRELTHRIYMEHYIPDSKTKIAKVMEHMRTAKGAGYNACLLMSGFNLDKTARKPISSLTGYSQVLAEAKRLKLDVVSPNVNAIMGAYANRQLAEVSAAKGTPFKVSGNVARCKSDHSTGLKNGNFESFSGNNPTGWQQRNLVGSLVRDGANKHGGSSSLRASNIKAQSYIHQDITVKPYRVYRITAWFKTSSLATIRDVEFVVKGREELLNRRWVPFATPNGNGWYNNPFRTTMNWTRCITDFNSQSNSKVNVAFWFATAGYGAGAHPGGSIWIDDMTVEEVGLYETIRRKDCPIIVKSADGTKTYKEGTDYVVDPICNKFTAKTSNYEGHLKIPAGSSIQNGQILKVDWFKYSDNYLYTSETDFCIPETWDEVRQNVANIDKLMGHSNWSFMNFDEWRSGFQSMHCPMFPKARTAGQYMAATLAKSVETIRCVNNTKRELWLYNDMFDPYHNAHSPYAMNVGGAANSYKGMDKDIIIINWRHTSQSYAFYMGLDAKRKGIVNRQILFCQGANEVPHKIGIVKSLESRGGKGMIGMLWCTWYDRWQHLALTANAWKANGWWGSKPLPKPGMQTPICKTDVKDGGHVAKVIPASRLRLFNGSETCGIEYNLPFHARVDLRVVDARGRTIRNLVSKGQKMGTHRVNLKSRTIPAGVYFFSLSIDGQMSKIVRHVVM